MNFRNLTVLIVLVVGLTRTVVNGQDAQFPPAAWRAQCALDGKSFEIYFTSQSGYWDNDDMLVSLKTIQGNMVALQLPQALYIERGSVSNAPNLCDLQKYIHPAKTVACPVQDTTVLFFLSKNGRPNFDTIVLALVNVETGALLDMLETDLAIKDPDGHTNLTIKKVADGFHVRLVTEYFQEAPSDGPEVCIEHWVPVTINGNKIELHSPITP